MNAKTKIAVFAAIALTSAVTALFVVTNSGVVVMGTALTVLLFAR